MGRNKTISADHPENFPLFIKHLELMQRRQKILVRIHDDHSVEQAISNAKENAISLILDYAKAYYAGEKWPNARRDSLKIKVNGRFYYDITKGG